MFVADILSQNTCLACMSSATLGVHGLCKREIDGSGSSVEFSCGMY